MAVKQSATYKLGTVRKPGTGHKRGALPEGKNYGIDTPGPSAESVAAGGDADRNWGSDEEFMIWYQSNFDTSAELADWVAHQDPSLQDEVGTYNIPGLQKQIDKVRQDAAMNGEVLPGMSESYAHSGLDKDQRAQGMQDDNVRDAKELFESVSTNLDDYTYKPTLEGGLKYTPQDRYKYTGDVDPLELAEQASAIDQVRTDETGIDAQKSTLKEYQDLYAQGGLNAIDRARMADSRRIRGAQARGQEQAIMADAAEQGRGGGNMALVGRLMAQQNAQNLQASDDLSTQALGLARRDSLLGATADVGYQVQTAQDAIDHFNTLGERDRIKQNLDRQNDAKTKTFDRNADREETRDDQYNKGVDLTFDEDTDRGMRNADRTTDASKFNVGPGQGQRGITADRSAALGNLVGTRNNDANTLMARHGAQKAAEGAATQRWIDAAGEGGDVAAKIFSWGTAEDDSVSGKKK